MSELNMPSVSSKRIVPEGWRGWLALVSGIITVIAVGYLPAWLALNALIASPLAEDMLAAGYLVSLFAASLLSLVAGFANRHAEPYHGLMRLPGGVWSLAAMALAALFVPSVALATGNTLLDAMSAWGYTGESPLYTAIQATAGWSALLSGIGGFGAAVVALVRRDRSLALVLPMGAGLVVAAFVVGELIGHA